MISTSEFTVGSASSCAPLSLILPRHASEEALLIDTSNTGNSAALVLNGSQQFTWHQAVDEGNAHGLIFAGVRIEIDETSVFSLEDSHSKPGDLVRKETVLLVRAKGKLGAVDFIVLESDLTSTGTLSAGFRKWQIVLGSGHEKRVLWQIGQGLDAPPGPPR